MSTQTPISVPFGPLYDRDAIIESIKQYFELLSRMVSFRPECIKSPPKNGWSDDELPLEKFRILGFNERVVDLLRHLPYVESEKPIYPSTQSISYLKDSHLFSEPEREFRTKQPLVLELWPLEGEKIHEGIVALSGQADGGLAMWWLLDTRTCEVTPHDAYTHVSDEEIPENEPWRTDKPRLAVEYFKELRESLISLEMIPIPTHMPGGDWKIWRVRDFGEEHRHWVHEAQDIYRECGWPAEDRFDRSKCRSLLKKILKKR
ncbi:hypothetical protein CORC01_00717 [Colletotrichum orchidophilum]|uniref:Uncharacterized protein n=1 Tax=Colletotrichum orchidophilum TaxID=1209926 RepID=A0A1G4BRD4_9PEZI|nr:uncharacterized protein CORC01_00717 [Colletotrichum orchidophilum]OHF03855.1 hypothetical protein CORC01_00717 [Colletotrichum orchidophilum]